MRGRSPSQYIERGKEAKPIAKNEIEKQNAYVKSLQLSRYVRTPTERILSRFIYVEGVRNE